MLNVKSLFTGWFKFKFFSSERGWKFFLFYFLYQSLRAVFSPPSVKKNSYFVRSDSGLGTMMKGDQGPGTNFHGAHFSKRAVLNRDSGWITHP